MSGTSVALPVDQLSIASGVTAPRMSSGMGCGFDVEDRLTANAGAILPMPRALMKYQAHAQLADVHDAHLLFPQRPPGDSS